MEFCRFKFIINEYRCQRGAIPAFKSQDASTNPRCEPGPGLTTTVTRLAVKEDNKLKLKGDKGI